MTEDLLFYGSLFFVLGTVLVVSVLRWALRIDVIVSELKAIRKALSKEEKPIATPKKAKTFWDAFLYRE